MRPWKTFPLTLLTLSVALSGCFGGAGADGTTGSFTLSIMDDAPSSVHIEVKSIDVHERNGSWARIAGNDTVWDLSGTDTAIDMQKDIPAGDYDLLSVRFRAVAVDGEDLVMAANGFDMPFEFRVTEGGETTYALAFGWQESLYDSEEGLTFYPVPVRLTITVDGEQTVNVEQAALDPRKPVARMRIFAENGFTLYESDFIADDPPQRVVGTAGLLTLSGVGSESLEADAEIVGYTWYVDGEEAATGPTVQLPFPVSGGNFTVKLTATDNNGKSDDLTVKLILAPGSLSVTHVFRGNVSGAVVLGNNEGASGDTQVALNVTTTAFEGVKAQLVQASGSLTALDDTTGFGTAVSMTVQDGRGATVGSVDLDDTFSRDYPVGAPPEGGEWTVTFDPDRSAGTEYLGTLTLTYQGLNPDVTKYLSRYSDSHTHCHPGIDEGC